MRLDDFDKVLRPEVAPLYFNDARWALLNAGVVDIDACIFDVDRLADGKTVAVAFGKDREGTPYVWTKRVATGALRDR
jgi:hypothetical protein